MDEHGRNLRAKTNAKRNCKEKHSDEPCGIQVVYAVFDDESAPFRLVLGKEKNSETGQTTVLYLLRGHPLPVSSGCLRANAWSKR